MCVCRPEVKTPYCGRPGCERPPQAVPPVADRRKDIQRRLKEHDAARKPIEAELLALQHVCDHANAKTWHDDGWGRMPSTEWECPDCGLRRSS